MKNILVSDTHTQTSLIQQSKDFMPPLVAQSVYYEEQKVTWDKVSVTNIFQYFII